MNTKRRTLSAAIAATALFAIAPLTQAQAAYPEKPVTIVSPFGAGSSADTIGRLYAQKMSELLGQQFLIEQKTGAGTTLAAGYVARAAPDGYTLMLASNSPFSLAPHTIGNITYDPQRDFTVITTLYSTVAVLLAKTDFPANSLEELLDMARKNPASANYASYGTGTSSHLMMEMLKERTGVSMLHIPYRSPQESTTAVLGGFANVSFETVPSAAARVSSGQMKALAVFGPRQYASLGNAKTVRESGYDGVDIVATYALVAPAGTPQEVVERLQKATQKVVSDAEFLKRLEDYGCDPLDMTPEAFKAAMAAESDRVGKIAAKLNLKD